MPNPSKSVACCELAAHLSIPTTRYRGLSRKWNFIRGGASRKPLRTRLSDRQSAWVVPSDLNGLGATSCFVKAARCLINAHSRRRHIHTHLSAEPNSNPDPQSPSLIIRRVPFEGEQLERRPWKPQPRAKSLVAKNASRKLPHSYNQVKASTAGIRSSNRFQKGATPEGMGYASPTAVPKRVKAVVDRCINLLEKKGKVISKENFKFEIKLRTKSMYSYESIPSWWIVFFQDLFMRATEGKLDSWHMPPRVDNFTNQLIDTIENHGIKSFKEKWDTLDSNVKAAQWPLIAFWLLRNSAAKIPEFLLTTNSEPYPPFGMVSDCMLYLTYFHKEIHTEVIRDVVMACMDPERWPVIVVPQRGIRTYVKFADLKSLHRAFDIVRSRETHVSAVTVLAFMSAFTRAGDVEKSLECLRMIPALSSEPGGLSMDSEGVIRHCCKLLQLDEVLEEDGVRNFKILPQILELGVIPSIEMMNVVIANAFATGDSHLGLDMLSYVKDRGMKLSSYTYYILLKDAVARVDRGRFDLILQEINSRDDLRTNKFIIDKIFHGRFVFGTKSQRYSAGVFLDMLVFYSRYYNLTPLRDLGIIPEYYNNVEVERDAQPTPVTLLIMIAMYLRCNRSPTRSLRIYQKFRQLVAERNPVISPLAQYTSLFNEFILTFRHSHPDLNDCISIVQDMLNPDIEPFMLGDQLIKHAKPNSWTWNTLMSVFVAHNKPDAVKWIQETMQNHGIEYDIVTWNTILNSTARSQNITGTTVAMEEMDSRGYPINAYTQRALSHVHAPELLQSAMLKLNEAAENLILEEQKVLERENDELLDKGLKRLATVSRET